MTSHDNFEDTLASRATELFNICDQQNRGYITEDDLSHVAQQLDLPLTEEQIALTFNKLDKDHNKHLTLAEFISGFDLFLGANDTDTNYNTLDYTQGHQLFDLCDREQKGYIVKSDLERLSEEFQLSEEQLGDLFHSLDIDGNGRLTLEEFVAGFGKFLESAQSDDSHEQEGEYPLSPAERIYESHNNSGMNSPALSEDALFEKIADKVGDDLLSGVLSKGQLLDLWKALSSNEMIGFEKLTEFLTNVSQEIKRSQTQALTVEQALKGQVEAREMEIQKLYDKLDTQIQAERHDMSSHHERKEKEIREEYQNEMALKEKELQELLNQQKELEKKIQHLNQADLDVKEENIRLQEANMQLQNELDESSSSLQDTKSYVQQLQSLTNEERKERQRTAMIIAQGMQKEHESLLKQLDMLKEVNQSLRDQKDAIQAAHEAQCAQYVSLRDELALAQTLESSPVKEHKPVNRTGSTMSKYFTPFEGGMQRQDSRLESVTEAKDIPLTSSPSKRKLTRTKGSVPFAQPTKSVSLDILEYASIADGAEFENDRVFEEGELTEAERSEWMEKIHHVTAPIMSEAEKQRTEQEFRKQKEKIVPQAMTPIGQHQMLQASDEEDGAKGKIPLSPRTSPVGTDTEVQTVEQKRSPSLEPESNIQRVYKVVFVGDSGVGKSSFIHRYCYEIWKPSYTATIGVDFQVKSVQLGLKKLALQLWDTAGQERFRSITKQYFRKADGVVLLYDLTSEPSFVNIKSWMTSVEEAAEPGCTVMLIGNKLDLCEEDQKWRAVAFKHAEELAEEYGCLYAEASAKSGKNVNEAMETLAKRLQEQEDWQIHSVLQLKLDEEKKKSKCCGR